MEKPSTPPSLATAGIAVIGLGYVGLPLAVAFADKYAVTGFDISDKRIGQLREGVDRTRELSAEKLSGAHNLRLTSDAADLSDCNVFIVTVPTPIDRHKRPDLGPLISASRTVATALKPGDVVVYESTVYPGATEEDCVPVLEEVSGLAFNQDFYAGYSPERINPGDKAHTVRDIVKVTSGSTPEVADFLDDLYASIVTAGTHKAASIKVAEAAKVIENTQRDVNIALVNELAMLFGRMGLDTHAVLEAAGTKWNFLPFRPGLVGGHCIGVDPYYLTHKAQEIGHHPEMILAGRRINDNMGRHVAGELLRLMAERGQSMVGSRVLVMGLAFKENCPDLRNTRVIDVIAELQRFNARVDIHDPWVDSAEAEEEYGLQLVAELEPGDYDAVVLAVGHREFVDLGAAGVRRYLKPDGCLFDIRGIYPRDAVDGRL